MLLLLLLQLLLLLFNAVTVVSIFTLNVAVAALHSE